jgi:hypothetical protein
MPAPDARTRHSIAHADAEANVDQYTGRMIAQSMAPPSMSAEAPRRTAVAGPAPPAPGGGRAGVDRTQRMGRSGLFTYTVEEGHKVLAIHKTGRMRIIEGPARVWRWGHRFVPMAHHVAHPGEFLLVRYRDGRQEHVRGPAHLWFDERQHLSVGKKTRCRSPPARPWWSTPATRRGGAPTRGRRAPRSSCPRPASGCTPSPGTAPGRRRRLPARCRTHWCFRSSGCCPTRCTTTCTTSGRPTTRVLTIRLMIFFELVDIERMLASTHDPIGDFVNAATSDVVDLTRPTRLRSRSSAIPRSSTSSPRTRSSPCAPAVRLPHRQGGLPRLRRPRLAAAMHDKAIESRTRLALERATQQQAQELEDFTQERSLVRGERLRADRRRRDRPRDRPGAPAAGGRPRGRARPADLSARAAADQVLELRGGATPHVHVEPRRKG